MKLVETTDTILHQISQKFDFSNTFMDPEELFSIMKKIMVENRGIGLAAPQIGLDTRIFIMGDDFSQEPFFNPEIVKISKDAIMGGEGCLSYPGLILKIKRPQWIDVKFQNIKGQEIFKRFTDIWARCYAHELEHLEGICFVDKVGPLAMNMALDKLNKKIKRQK
jgi:peptide deformylase